MRKSGTLLLLCLLCFSFVGKAQEVVTEAADTIRTEYVGAPVDSFIPAEEDSRVRIVIQAADSIGVPDIRVKQAFKPNPTTATLLAIIPGMGQIYNRKYWKLPIVYGGLMGCFYAITWNNRNYQEYKEAYFDLLSDDPATNDSWRDFVRQPNLSQKEENEQYIDNAAFEQELKTKKDYFRRYRDLSIIVSVAVYAITVLDAYVDAQLFDFDVSPDLSMRVEPVVTPKTSFSARTYGVNCSFTF